MVKGSSITQEGGISIVKDFSITQVGVEETGN